MANNNRTTESSVYDELTPYELFRLETKLKFYWDRAPVSPVRPHCVENNFDVCPIFGYPRVRVYSNYEELKRGAHQVVALMKFGRYCLKEGEEVSHLCDNKLCIRPAHIHIESKQENLSRKGCFKLATIDTPCNKHHPPCIK